MFKIGGYFEYEYHVNGKLVRKQKRHNIINIRLSIPCKQKKEQTDEDDIKVTKSYDFETNEMVYHMEKEGGEI